MALQANFYELIGEEHGQYYAPEKQTELEGWLAGPSVVGEVGRHKARLA